MIGESPKRVPGGVIVAGSLWLLTTGGLLAWSVCLLIVFGVISNFTPGGMDDFPQAPPAAQPLYLAFKHYVLTGSILGALGLVGVYGGIQFLRLKPWARTFLEAGGWTAMALSFVLGVWQSQFWVDPGPRDATGFGNGILHGTAKLFVGLMITAYYAIFPVVFVWLLRSRWVRPAFSSGAWIEPGRTIGKTALPAAKDDRSV